MPSGYSTINILGNILSASAITASGAINAATGAITGALTSGSALITGALGVQGTINSVGPVLSQNAAVSIGIISESFSDDAIMGYTFKVDHIDKDEYDNVTGVHIIVKDEFGTEDSYSCPLYTTRHLTGGRTDVYCSWADELGSGDVVYANLLVSPSL
jgi:hypothetical protein